MYSYDPSFFFRSFCFFEVHPPNKPPLTWPWVFFSVDCSLLSFFFFRILLSLVLFLQSLTRRTVYNLFLGWMWNCTLPEAVNSNVLLWANNSNFHRQRREMFSSSLLRFFAGLIRKTFTCLCVLNYSRCPVFVRSKSCTLREMRCVFYLLLFHLFLLLLIFVPCIPFVWVKQSAVL